MVRTLLTSFEWGGTTGLLPDVAHVVGTLQRAPIEVVVLNPSQYPDTWTIAGNCGLRTLTGDLAGITQAIPIYMRGSTLIYPRGAVLNQGPPAVMRSYNFVFEPLPWIDDGEIEIFYDPVIAYGGQANWGGS